MLKEFKEFALRGNVIDLAVGVIIGGAFGRIVSSLVSDVFMPIIGIIVGGVNLTELKLVLAPASGDMAEVAVRYGVFLQSVVDFVIVAASIFIFIKLIAAKKKQEADVPPAPVATTPEVALLEQIRDLLRAKQ